MCSIPITVIREAPFYLTWGSSISVQIVAINSVGYSVTTTTSTVSTGVVIVTYPDAPINIASLVNITYGNQIGITWSQGVQTGGSAIIDYRINYD
jgi:hypothetical protein